MKPGRSTLRQRMVLTLLACFLPMVIIITLLFGESISTQRKAEAETLQYTAQDIANALDRYNYGVYNVSDAFCTDERLLDILDRDYTGNANARQYAITHANGALFESYARLVQQKKIDAIYIVNRDDVMDFLDPNQSIDLLLQEMQRLDVDDVAKYGNFYMYPLQPNFLSTREFTNARQDHVIIGSRRVYNHYKSGYPYVHIFAIPEQTLYDLYELQAKHIGAEVYILNSDGKLISSTNELAVATCWLPKDVTTAYESLSEPYGSVWIDGTNYNVARADCESTDWTALVLVPAAKLTAATASLYMKTLLVIAVCGSVFAALLLFFYRRFMAPLAEMEQAMRRADAGDLKAYVKPKGTAEVAHMMEGYNAMLDGIRVALDQRMELQRHKQDLEMQVLMSQINPHFLYNTLETIVWKAGEAGRTDIGKMAASLGKLYRLSIAGGLFVPLSKELEHVRMYMNIQQSRYGNKVAYDVRLHGVEAAEVETLKLILQPVVENSLLYGMDGLDHTLSIRISARKRGDDLVLTVTDNGIGMNEETLEKLRDQIVNGRKPDAEKNRRSTGIGLHNIAARLSLYAGKKSGITVWSLPGIGTQVELTLPWRSTLHKE